MANSHKKFQFTVNTVGLCFLCYKEAEETVTSSVENAPDKNSSNCNGKSSGEDSDCDALFTKIKIVKKKRIHSFKNLCKYLKVDLCEGINNLPGHLLPLLKMADLRVSLCKKCGLLARKFTKLYEEMEITKLKMDSVIKCFQERHNKAERNVERMDNFKEKLKFQQGRCQNHPKMVENLRRLVMLKCQMKVKRSLPRLKLKKITDYLPPPSSVPKIISVSSMAPATKPSVVIRNINSNSNPLQMPVTAAPLVNRNLLPSPILCQSLPSDMSSLEVEEVQGITIQTLLETSRQTVFLKTNTFPCGSCKRSFTSFVDLRRHEQNKHPLYNTSLVSRCLRKIKDRHVSTGISAESLKILTQIPNLNVRHTGGHSMDNSLIPGHKDNGLSGQSDKTNLIIATVTEWQCFLCPSKFLTVAELELHQSSVHSQQQNVETASQVSSDLQANNNSLETHENAGVNHQSIEFKKDSGDSILRRALNKDDSDSRPIPIFTFSEEEDVKLNSFHNNQPVAQQEFPKLAKSPKIDKDSPDFSLLEDLILPSDPKEIAELTLNKIVTEINLKNLWNCMELG